MKQFCIVADSIEISAVGRHSVSLTFNADSKELLAEFEVIEGLERRGPVETRIGN